MLFQGLSFDDEFRPGESAGISPPAVHQVAVDAP